MSNFRPACLHSILIFSLTLLAPAIARSQVFQTWIGPNPTNNWNDSANWLNGFVPDVDFGDEAARIANGGTANVTETVPRVGALDVSGTAGSAVAVSSGGLLRTFGFSASSGNGSATVASTGTLAVSGSGIVRVGDQASGAFNVGNLTNAGTLSVTGPSATFSVRGNYVNSGTLVAGITSAASHTPIQVTGNAQLGGTLRAEFTGVTPTYGQSWNLVNAGSISGNFSNFEVAGATLAQGLSVRLNTTGGNASMQVTNTLVLTVNRLTGDALIRNVIGAPISIAGYSIQSDNGLLQTAGWNNLAGSGAAGAGWTVANPTANSLTELNLSSFNVNVGASLSLGTPYNGASATPEQEDLVFKYVNANNEVLSGIVEYVGIVSDLALYVDPTTGAVAIGSLSGHFPVKDMTGYTIRSSNGSLLPGGWNRFSTSGVAGPGWTAVPSTANGVGELNLAESVLVAPYSQASLGTLFDTTKEKDLIFEYATADGDIATGTVVYAPIPATPIAHDGDYDVDGDVDGADFLAWQRTFGKRTFAGGGADGNANGVIDAPDLTEWRTNFGFASATSAVGSVPEPATLWMALAALAGACRFGGKTRR